MHNSLVVDIARFLDFNNSALLGIQAQLYTLPDNPVRNYTVHAVYMLVLSFPSMARVRLASILLLDVCFI